MAALLTSPGCDRAPSAPQTVPAPPDLTGVEPPVARAVTRAFAAAERAPSATTLGAYARVLHAHGMLTVAERAYVAAAAAARDAVAFENLHLAGVAASERSPQTAIGHLERAGEHKADYVPTWLLLGRLHEASGALDAARRAYRHAESIRNTAHGRTGLGRVMLALGEVDAAHEHLNAALQLDKTHREAFEALARCLQRLGHPEMSAAAAARAGKLSRTTPVEDPLQRAVLVQNVSSEFQLRRAEAQLRAGQFDAAMRSVRVVLEADGNHAPARALERRIQLLLREQRRR